MGRGEGQVQLSAEQIACIVRALEDLDYGRVIVTVGDRGYVEITTERRVRVKSKQQLDTNNRSADTVAR